MADDKAHIAGMLAQTRLFGGLPQDVLAAFAQRFHLRVAHTGETVFRQGDSVSALYVVGTGRLRAYGHGPDGERALGEIGSLETMGEISILSAEKHTASVRAVRDTVLISINRIALMELLQRHPEALMQLSQVVVGRLLERLRGHDPGPPAPRSFAVIPGHPGADVRAVAAGLTQELSKIARARHLTPHEVDAALGAGISGARFDDAEANANLVSWLNTQEAQNGYVIYEGAGDPGPWPRRCMRQADRILVVVEENAGPAEITPMLKLLRETDIEAPCAVIVRLHRKASSATDPLGWRHQAEADAHYFVHQDRPGDMASLARSMVGQGVGIVLGGGGARGFAHLGLLRAARDLRIPIDVIGGTSMGAFIAALHAQGRGLDDITSVVRETFVSRNFLNDYMLPRVALIRARKFRSRLQAVFAENQIEHLHTPYFCVTTSLTRGQSVIHDRGPMHLWVGTSMAIPGIAPPVAWNEELLADGAVLNNLPTDVMRRLGRGAVIACDVSSGTALRAEGVAGPDPEALFNWSGRSERPSLFDILLRSATLSSNSSGNSRAKIADCYVRMPVAGVGMFQWKSMDRLLDSAYEHALGQLEAFRDKLPPLAKAAL